jgi:hypothetical protein
VDDGLFQNGRTYYRCHAETDLVKAGSRKEQLDQLLEQEMDSCVFSALIFDKRSDTYRLHASVFAESEIASWISRFFQAAAKIQVTTAYRIVDQITKTLPVSKGLSSHPTGGVREHRDEMAIEALGPYVTEGHLPCRWMDIDEWRDVDWAMERQAMAWSKSDGRKSISKFYWAPDPEQSIELKISADEPHPLLGAGVEFTLTVPLKMSCKHVAYMALELNEYERSNWLKTHMLGSWCNHNGTLAFRLFVPNSLYLDGVLHELSVTMASRAAWVNEFFVAKKRAAEQKKAGV